MKLAAMTDKNTALVPEEGWHCLHLFYRIEYGQWQLLSREEQNAAKTNLASLVQEIRAMDSTQLLTLSMVTPKADIGFHVDHARFADREQDREATFALVRPRCVNAGLQLFLAHGRKRIHHDGRRVRAEHSRRSRTSSATRRNLRKQ